MEIKSVTIDSQPSFPPAQGIDGRIASFPYLNYKITLHAETHFMRWTSYEDLLMKLAVAPEKGAKMSENERELAIIQNVAYGHSGGETGLWLTIETLYEQIILMLPQGKTEYLLETENIKNITELTGRPCVITHDQATGKVVFLSLFSRAKGE